MWGEDRQKQLFNDVKVGKVKVFRRGRCLWGFFIFDHDGKELLRAGMTHDECQTTTLELQKGEKLIGFKSWIHQRDADYAFHSDFEFLTALMRPPDPEN
jgi:hypothetical protein